jgi:hypothetical protein
LNNPKEKMEKCTIPSGYIAAHGHSGLPSLNPARWPSRRPLASPSWWAWPACAGQHGAQWHGRGLSAMRSLAQPSILLQLHTATPTPWRQRWERGPHRSNGSSMAALCVKVDKRLETWTEAPDLDSSAAQARVTPNF